VESGYTIDLLFVVRASAGGVTVGLGHEPEAPAKECRPLRWRLRLVSHFLLYAKRPSDRLVLGVHPEALRSRFNRLIKRVSRDLGLEE
jgi:hypothetical protein